MRMILIIVSLLFLSGYAESQNLQAPEQAPQTSSSGNVLQPAQPNLQQGSGLQDAGQPDSGSELQPAQPLSVEGQELAGRAENSPGWLLPLLLIVFLAGLILYFWPTKHLTSDGAR